MKLFDIIKEISPAWQKEVDALLDKRNRYKGNLSPAETERLNQLSKMDDDSYVPLEKRVHDWLDSKYSDLLTEVDTSSKYFTENFGLEMPSGKGRIVFSVVENTDKNQVILEMSHVMAYVPIATIFNISSRSQVIELFRDWVVNTYGGVYDKVEIFYDKLTNDAEEFLGVEL